VDQTFTIRADELARILTIGVGRDCKFKQNGATASERIVKPGARGKVSYFATVFTGNIAVEIDRNPKPKIESGVIEGNRYTQPKARSIGWNELASLGPALGHKCELH
jgi:hypothetical protein